MLGFINSAFYPPYHVTRKNCKYKKQAFRKAHKCPVPSNATTSPAPSLTIATFGECSLL